MHSLAFFLSSLTLNLTSLTCIPTMSSGGLTPEQQGVEAAILARIIQSLQDVQVTNYLTVASFALLLYDIFITFRREYGLVWRSKFSRGSALFFSMRYGNTLIFGIDLAFHLWVDPPKEFCHAWFYFTSWLSTFLLIPVSVFMAMRTYALYGRDPIYKWALITLLTVENLGLLACLSVATAQIKITTPLPGTTCAFNISGISRPAGIIQYSSAVVVDSVIFLLTIIRIIQLRSDVRIVKLLFWSCLMYYAVNLTACVASLAMYIGVPESRIALRGLLLGPTRTIPVILTSRLVLDLREIVRAPNMSVRSLCAPPKMLEDLQESTIQWRVAQPHNSSSTYIGHDEQGIHAD